MLRYIIKRLLQMVVVLLGVVLFVFILSRASGDPIPQLLGENYTQADYDAMYVELGFDRPLVVQYFDYVIGIITEMDLGTSYETNRAVSLEVFSRFPVSLRQAFLTLLWSVPFGVFCGLISAAKQYSLADYSLTTLAMIMASMPSFWVSLMLMLILSLSLGLLPATGLDSWKGYIIPCLALGLRPVATFTRMTRSSMLEVIRQDYIRTARSKGLAYRKVVTRHAFRNAAIPIVTSIGSTFSVIVGGSAVVENIFNIPGLGSYMIYSIGVGDYPSVQGGVLLFSVVVCLVNLLVDIAYMIIDPRIRDNKGFGGKRGRLQKAKPQAVLQGGNK